MQTRRVLLHVKAFPGWARSVPLGVWLRSDGVKGLTLKVSKQWIQDFNTVMEHHQRATPYTFGDAAIEECKAEAREHEAWALEFYPRAAAQIRKMQ